MRIVCRCCTRSVGSATCSVCRGTDRVSLRIRLLAGMLVLVSVALIVAAVAIYAEQRSFLSGRLDQRVVAAATPISYQLGVDARLLARPGLGQDPTRGVHKAPGLGWGLA